MSMEELVRKGIISVINNLALIHIDIFTFCMLKESSMKEKRTITNWFWWQLS
jgi:hypothetical protein